MSKKYTIDNFIKKALLIHNNKYSYEQVNYINYDTKIEITCPNHGTFWQTPNNHLKGKGCPNCAGNAKMTTETFIKRAKEKWGDKYDYSKVEYLNNSTKVCIKDIKGHEFWQTPANHLYGFDCANSKMNTQLFIEKAKGKWGDKYDYSKVNYTNNTEKVCIICPIHGEFWQLPHSHIKGRGCFKCGIERTHDFQRLTKEKFIRKAREVHGWKYDYSMVDYINNETKIKIICPVHGEFWQSPTSHLSNHGCPNCASNIPLTTDIFINRGKKLYGDKYSYSCSVYKDMKTKISIICNKHGLFTIYPGNFLKGQGCPECGKLFRKKENALYQNCLEHFPTVGIIHSYHNSKILKKQELDIYFPKYKIAIEFQGEQHFYPVDFGGYGREKACLQFAANQKRDIKKKEVCNNNGIILFYFSDVSQDYFLGEKIYHDYQELADAISQIIKTENEK